MHRYLVLTVFSCLLLMVIPSSFSKAQELPPAKTSEQWFELKNKLQEHFSKAASHFMYKRFAASADELQKGIELARDQLKRTQKEARPRLSAGIRQLENLAQRLEQGSVPWVKEIERVFLRVSADLAAHHLLNAKVFAEKNEMLMASHDLEAAVLHLEEGFHWAHQGIDAGSAEILKTAHELAQKMQAKKTYQSEAVPASIHGLNLVLEKLKKLSVTPG